MRIEHLPLLVLARFGASGAWRTMVLVVEVPGTSLPSPRILGKDGTVCECFHVFPNRSRTEFYVASRRNPVATGWSAEIIDGAKRPWPRGASAWLCLAGRSLPQHTVCKLTESGHADPDAPAGSPGSTSPAPQSPTPRPRVPGAPLPADNPRFDHV